MQDPTNMPPSMPPMGGGVPDFANMPPELQQALMEMIMQIMESGQLPPELAQIASQMPQGGPQDMGPPQQMGPPGGMPMPPMGGMPGGPPQGMPQGMPMPGPGMGMEQGGPVKSESMEDIHDKIAELKQKLKKKEQEIKEKYAPKKPGSQEGPPRHPLLLAEGGNVPPVPPRVPHFDEPNIAKNPADQYRYDWDQKSWVPKSDRKKLASSFPEEVAEGFDRLLARSEHQSRAAGGPRTKVGDLLTMSTYPETQIGGDPVYESPYSPHTRMEELYVGDYDPTDTSLRGVFDAKDWDLPKGKVFWPTSGLEEYIANDLSEKAGKMVPLTEGQETIGRELFYEGDRWQGSGDIDEALREKEWARSWLDNVKKHGLGPRQKGREEEVEEIFNRPIPEDPKTKLMTPKESRAASLRATRPPWEQTDVGYGPRSVYGYRPIEIMTEPELLETFPDYPGKANITDVTSYMPRFSSSVRGLGIARTDLAPKPSPFRYEETGVTDVTGQRPGEVGPSGTGNMRGPLLSESDIAAINRPKPVRMPLPSLSGVAKEPSLPEGYRGKAPPYNPYLDKPADLYPGSMPAPGTDPLARVYDRVMQHPAYKAELAETVSKVVSPQAKAARMAGRVLSSPITGAGASALGPLLSHLPIAGQYSADPEAMSYRDPRFMSLLNPEFQEDIGRAIRRAGLARAMELRPEMFAEPHMGPPKPKLSYDEAGWVVKKEPGDWSNLPQDPFQRYSDMPNREWEKEMGFGVNEVRRGETYLPSPFEFWNPPLYFPKSKEDLAANWPHGRGPLPEHLKP